VKTKFNGISEEQYYRPKLARWSLYNWQSLKIARLTTVSLTIWLMVVIFLLKQLYYMYSNFTRYKMTAYSVYPCCVKECCNSLNLQVQMAAGLRLPRSSQGFFSSFQTQLINHLKTYWYISSAFTSKFNHNHNAICKI